MPPLTKQPDRNLHRVIRALRREGDEVGLTCVIDALASADQRFATSFGALVLDEARRSKRSGAAHARALPNPAGEIVCERERPTGVRVGDLGRCDLWFSSSSPQVTLAVELKLQSRYTARQRERYVEELTRRVRGDCGLVVITARPQPEPTPTLAKNRRWLGEVTWEGLYGNGLADLEFEPTHDELRHVWRALVNTMVESGELGLLTSVDPKRFELWASGDPHVTYGHASDLLEGVASAAGDALDEMLAPHGLRSKPIPATDSGYLVYVRGKGYVLLTWALTPRGAEELQLLLTRTDGKGGDTRARLQVWYLPRPDQKHLYSPANSKRAGFHYDAQWHGWCRENRLDVANSGPELGRSILVHWRRGLRALEALGALEGLPVARQSET